MIFSLLKENNSTITRKVYQVWTMQTFHEIFLQCDSWWWCEKERRYNRALFGTVGYMQSVHSTVRVPYHLSALIKKAMSVCSSTLVVLQQTNTHSTIPLLAEWGGKKVWNFLLHVWRQEMLEKGVGFQLNLRGLRTLSIMVGFQEYLL